LTAPALGARHRELTRLRVLARDRGERDNAGLVVIDGPRAVDGALARHATIETIYVDADAHGAAADVARRAADSGARVREVAPGALERAGDVRTNAGLIALALRPVPPTRAALAHGACWLVCPEIGDPGNLGALLRSAEAAGAAGIVIGPGSADVYNPKSVRASAGALFGITVLEDDIVAVLSELATHGVQRVGAVARGGVASWSCRFAPRVALVLGHETRGLGAPGGASTRAGVQELDLDERVSIPMAGAAESLNVAAAATVLLFEVARRRAQVHT
jgi:TrmH family RNA methyltransferase